MRKVQIEFSEITETSVEENKKLQDRVARLELELSQGVATVNSKNTGAEVEKKREFEAIKDSHDKELKKNQAHIKKLDK